MKELLRNPDVFYKLLDLTVSTLDIDDMMIKLVEELRELFDCDRCTLYAVDRKANEVYTKVAQKSQLGHFRVPIDMNSLTGYVATTGKPILINDVYDASVVKAVDPKIKFSPDLDKRGAFKTENIISAPLKLRGEIIGLVQGLNKPGGFLKKDLAAMVEFSPILALALNNAVTLKEAVRGTRNSF